MNLFQRTLAFFNRLAAPGNPQLVRYITVPVRHAGVYIDHDTALKFSAVYRAIAYISQSIAGLPWDVLRETQDRTLKLPWHPVYRLLRLRANDEMSTFAWRETMLAWALSWGNGYSEIVFDEGGRPAALWPISPDRVQVKRGGFNQAGQFEADANGEIWYQVFNYSGDPSYIDADHMYHLHGLGYDGLIGYSVISMAARSIGLAEGAEQYAEDFFANGAVATGGLEVEKAMSDLSYQRLQKWVENQSKPGNKWKWPIFEGGAKWKPMALPNRDAQMLETREFQVTDIARWFGLPPHKLADLSRATFSNIESQSREVVNDCFMPWIQRLEQEANYKLFSGRERGIVTKINVRGLLRGDDASRSAYYLAMRSMGAYSVNDILRLEDMDPIGSEGDIRIAQAGQVNLKSLLSAAANPDQKALPPAPEQVQQSFAALVEDGFRRILRRESNRYEQSRHKFGEKSAFLDWLAAMRDQQREYMRTTLMPTLTAMVALCAHNGDLDPAIAGLTAVLNDAIDGHIKASEDDLEAMHAGKKDAIDIENRTKHEAKALIEAVFVSFSRESQCV